MSNPYCLPQIIRTCHNLLYNHEFFSRSRLKPSHFTRQRKIGFVDFMLLMISGIKHSLQAELNNFLDCRNRPNETYTKQAFSKGRERIRPEAFKELADTVIQEFYRLAESNTFRGYHILAIDGSRYNLPTNPKLKEMFGVQVTGGAEQPQALGSCLYDVLNGMIVDACLAGCRSSERDQAAEMIRRLDTRLIPHPVYVMDRGYPSGKLLELISGLEQHYLIRCDATFLRGIAWNGDDVVIEHKFVHSESTLRFRLLTVKLDNGANEYLLTNLFEEGLTVSDFAELYHLRWSLETKYDDLKGKMQLENFSGNTPTAVCQDFFATLYLANLAGVLAFDYREEVEALHNDPENLRRYKLNMNLTISAMKRHVVALLLCRSPKKGAVLLANIARRLRSCVVPIRPGRSETRKRRHNSSAFPQNRKLP